MKYYTKVLTLLKIMVHFSIFFIAGLLSSYMFYVTYGISCKNIGLIRFHYSEPITIIYKLTWGFGFILYLLAVLLIYRLGKKCRKKNIYTAYITGLIMPFSFIVTLLIISLLISKL